MTCRDEILEAFRRLSAGDPSASFSPRQIIDDMQNKGTRYKESTIRTHIVSRMCANASEHHGTVYADLERVDHGRYRLNGPSE